MPRWQAIALAAGAVGTAAAVCWKLLQREDEEEKAFFEMERSISQSTPETDVLYQEWLKLAGEDLKKQLTEVKVEELCADDALIVVDMQHDFVLKSDDNPDGGRFGVPEGETIATPICNLIRAAVEAGATVVATRDYHPYNHCSFAPSGGPYPPHCLQGTKGAQLLPEIAAAMQQAMEQRPRKAHIVFKGLHEDVDSFGALPYAGETHGRDRVTRATRADHEDFAKYGACMGCAQAPWTGSLALQQSAVQAAAAQQSEVYGPLTLDPNAPPDVLAVLPDGVHRNRRTLQDLLKDTKGRIIACGLALDFCVLDTCRNARALGFDQVALCVEAARAAHVHAVGSFGSGFLQDPAWVAAEMKDAHIQGVGLKGLLGSTANTTAVAGSAMLNFPLRLHSIGLRDAPGLKLSLDLPPLTAAASDTGCYKLELVGALAPLARVKDFDNGGVVSPAARVPADWPGKHKAATHICWAYPMTGLSAGNVPREARMAFLSISSSPELRFAAHGGFVLLDSHRRVVQTQALGDEQDRRILRFANPRKWRPEFTPQIQKQRLQKITLPELKARGAEFFCWLGPEEAFDFGPERWVPAAAGAFLYLRAHGQPPLFFPRLP